MFNLHTHHPQAAAPTDWLEITNHSLGQPLPPAARWRSVGLHPWWLEGVDLDEAEQWLRHEATQPDVLAIGECGLDKVTTTPWALQEAALERCIRVAHDTGKPLVLHCVKAFEEVLLFKKRAAPQTAQHPPAWILHGFDKHPDTAQMLLRAGCYLSFGAALFRPNSHAPAALAATPLDRIFLETDVSESYDIAAVYAEAARIKGLKTNELVEVIRRNWQTATGVKPVAKESISKP